MELKVTLDFACCGCAQTIRVTLQCSGSGLDAGCGGLATVAVPCPTCSAISCVEFEPGGAVRAVTPAGPRRPLLEPSIN